MESFWRASITAISALTLFAACSTEDAEDDRLQSPNILWITVDTLRADHLGCYGYFRETSPHIDALADQSILFERCLSPMATTLPAHLSMLTSTLPIEHGVLANALLSGEAYVIPERLESFAQTLGAAGYNTAAFISALPLKPWTGIHSGFETFDVPESPERRAGRTISRALKWLDTARDEQRPFFLWVHLFDPHTPHEAPEQYATRFEFDEQAESFLAEREVPEVCTRLGGREFRSRENIDPYDAEIAYADAQLGRLLRWLRNSGVAERTVVTLVADHGEGLGQHGEPAHSSIWDEQLHVAWLLHVPGEPPRRVAQQVASIDLFPTLLGRVSIPGTEAFVEQATGADVLMPGFGGGPQWSQSSSSITYFDRPVQYVVSLWPWKYVAPLDGPGRLYHLERDPHELTDVAEQYPEQRKKLAAMMATLREQQELRSARFEAGGRASLDTQTMKGLGDLGYTGDSTE